jgi:hypothetical protein
LVLIGGFGTGYALRTLRAIERQTAAMIESQRPQIAAELGKDPRDTIGDGEAPRIEIDLSNRGQTPARNFKYESWIEILPLPFEDFTTAADHFVSSDVIVVYPNHKALAINIPIRTGITQQQLRDIKQGKQHVCVRINATFADAFNPARSVSFGYVVRPDGLVPLPKYNWER